MPSIDSYISKKKKKNVSYHKYFHNDGEMFFTDLHSTFSKCLWNIILIRLPL